METSTLQLERKKYFLSILNKIKNASDATLDIIADNELCNIKLIERSSKSMKDPNPLATVMSTMALKYPLSIDREKAKKYNIPKEFLQSEGASEVRDMHHASRILCKKEAIDWWVDESPLPDDSIKAVIDILFRMPREEVKKYYSIEWQSIRIGQVNVERKMIQTKEPLIAADKRTRETIIESIFFPDAVICYEHFPESLTKGVRELVKANVCSHMALASQMRVVLSQLDPRFKIIPVPSGFPDHIAGIKHAIMGANFTIRHRPIKNKGPVNALSAVIQHVSSCIVLESKLQKATLQDIIECLSNTFVEGNQFSKLVRTITLKETPVIKVIRSALGLPVISETSNDGLITSPNPSKVICHRMSNLGGTAYNVYLGMETVNFKYGDLRGTFSHNGAVINNVSTNFTTFRELRNALVEIAIYCRWNFNVTTAKNYQSMKNQARRYTSNNLGHLLQIEPVDLSRLERNTRIPHSYGILHLARASEYKAGLTQHMVIKYPEINLIIPGTNQALVIDTPTSSSRVLPETVKSNSPLLLGHLSLKELIRVVMFELCEKFNLLIKYIHEDNFKWKNEHFPKFIRDKGANLSQYCRAITPALIKEMAPKQLVAFFYLWTHVDPSIDTPTTPSVRTTNNQLLDMLGQSGIFTYAQNEEFLLYNVKIAEFSPVSFSRSTSGIFPGYRLLAETDNTVPLVPIAVLQHQSSTIEPGKAYNTLIEGRKITVVRDDSIAWDTEETIARQLTAYQNKKIAERVSVLDILRKRVLDMSDMSEYTIPAKRMRQDSNNGEDMLDEDAEYADQYAFDDEELDL
uniref:PB2 n=1 Tax=Lestrade virus TaxID=2600332 RepID=A0A5B8X9W7_9ORTO|nr:PB2 [Lestrade virus]